MKINNKSKFSNFSIILIIFSTSLSIYSNGLEITIKSILALFSIFSFIYYPSFIYIVYRANKEGVEWAINMRKKLIISISLVISIVFVFSQEKRIQIFILVFSAFMLAFLLVMDLIRRWLKK